MDVGAWLRGLGLGQYEAAFLKNDIDAEVLRELTEADFAPVRRRVDVSRGSQSNSCAGTRSGAPPGAARRYCAGHGTV
jgi:hypothetical protein